LFRSRREGRVGEKKKKKKTSERLSRLRPPRLGVAKTSLSLSLRLYF